MSVIETNLPGTLNVGSVVDGPHPPNINGSQIVEGNHQPSRFSGPWLYKARRPLSTSPDISLVHHVALHLPRIVRGIAHILGAVHVATHLPSSHTSAREPSTSCVAPWTSPAPSTSPRMFPRRRLRRTRPPGCILPSTRPPRPARRPPPPSQCVRCRTCPRRRSRPRACPLVAHIAAGAFHIVRGAAHALCAVRVAVHVPLSCTSPCAPSTFIHPEHVFRAPHVAAYLPRGMHGAEHVPHIVHKGVHDSRFPHAPRHVIVHLPGVVVHGSGFVLVAAHVPRVCCIAAHVPHGTRRRCIALRERSVHMLHHAAAAPSCTNINVRGLLTFFCTL
ncbi:hypothetical protein B0H14DRAFT_3857520 [Mycena olivaceomarginata]|nr:hypothetical protein B0H14DRAFT_3857520 [Mycena olivaceomarginata]